MPTRASTPKQTSGGGYLFENEVVAYVLAHLLARRSPFDPPRGVIERVAPQRPATEWHLDDLLVTVRAHARMHSLGCSIRSNPQITAGGFPQDFIRAAWDQLLHTRSDVFDESVDYLVLITSPIDSRLSHDVSELLRLARVQDPRDLTYQVGLEGRVNDVIRALHASARCPSDLVSEHDSNEDPSPGRLLRRFLWLPFDLEEEGSRRRSEALALCRDLLFSGSSDEAPALWAKLREVADRYRRGSGTIDLVRLVGELREEFQLRDFPDYSKDWNRIDDDTRSALARVRTTIGGTVALPREAERRQIAEAFTGSRAVVLLGAHGTGKSSLAKMESEGVKTLWLDPSRIRARTLAEWRTHLGLAHSLQDLIDSTPAADALLVLDGLDRIYDGDDFATVAEFARACGVGDPKSPWRLLITCTREDWGRVREMLTSQELRLLDRAVHVELPEDKELDEVWIAFPHLRALRGRRHLTPVLLRPKVLDLLAAHSSHRDNLNLLGESHLARHLWDRMIAKGPRAVSRGEAAGRIADRLADELEPDLAEPAVTAGQPAIDPRAVDDLIQDRILLRVEGRVAFEHDLYGDWVRSRRLLAANETGDLAGFLKDRMGSPIWHRALRLLGIDLIEQSEGLARWRQAFETVGEIPGSSAIVAQDILLESTAFTAATDAGILHDELWPLLAAQEGQLLARLLGRLRQAATAPNALLVNMGLERVPDLGLHLASTFRLPSGPYWYGILGLLHQHRQEIPVGAQRLAASTADLWLRSSRPSWPLRKEAAAIAVTLGDALLKDKEENDRFYHKGERDREIYRAVLAAGHEEPGRVEQIVLEAAGRRDRRFLPTPPTEEDLAERRRKLAAAGAPLALRRHALPDPWPHGPAFRVDAALQEVVLETDGLAPLTDALPEVARETVLALLISEPSRRSRYDNPYRLDLGLACRSWYPQFYLKGPFLRLLQQNEAIGLEVIVQLVDHVTDRWAEGVRHHKARERGCSTEAIEPQTIPVEVEGEIRDYVGDERVFGWCVFLPEDGDSVGCALAALEKHLYDCADAEIDLTPLVHRLLMESHSLAIVGLLSVVGRRHPRYFRGPLRGLLGRPEFLWWTLRGSVEPSWEYSLVPGLGLVPEPLRKPYREWHEMPHRKLSLRDVATVLLMNDPDTRSYLLGVRDRLIENLQPGGTYEGWSFAENLAAQLDPENYRVVQGDDETTYQYVPPPDLRRKHPEAEEEETVAQTLITLPVQCRSLLGSDGPVEAESLDVLWEHAQRLEELDPAAGPEMAPPANSLAAIAAVLTLRGGGWLRTYPDRAQWARKVLLQAAREDRTNEDFGIATQWDRQSFASEAIPTIWADRPQESEIREAVAQLACHGSPSVIGPLVLGVARIRERMPDDHKRLVRAVLLRTGIMPRLRTADQNCYFSAGEDKEVDWRRVAEKTRTELATVGRELRDGTLVARIPTLEEVAPASSRSRERLAANGGRRATAERSIDENLAAAAYQGVPIPQPGELEPWLGVWTAIAHDLTTPLAQPDDEPSKEPDRIPGVLDRYLLERLGDSVWSVGDPELARLLWQPIIELGASAPEWVSIFARHWTRYTLHPSADDSVVTSWTAMIDDALESNRWAGGSRGTAAAYDTGKLWRALLGFDHGTPEIWSEELRPRFRRLKRRLETWARAHLSDPDNACGFAHVLTLPAAADLRVDGTAWLHEALIGAGDSFWKWPCRVDATEDAILSLLDHVWSTQRTEFRSSARLSGAFRSLLETLVSRQNRGALELAERVAEVRRAKGPDGC